MDPIIIEYEARIAQVEAALTRLEGDLKKVANAQSDVNKETKKSTGIVNELRASTQKLTEARDKSTNPAQIKELNKQIDAQNKKLKEVTATTQTLGDKFKELTDQLPFAAQAKQVVELGSAVTGLGSKAASSAGGFNILKAAVIGTGIGALVIAIIALIAYFRRTDEGAAKLAGVMSALGAATDLVTGAIASAGEAIYNASISFDGFKNILSDIGDFLISQFVNRFNAAIDTIIIFKDVIVDFAKNGLDADFTSATKRANDAQLEFITGVKDAGPKIDKWSAEVAAAAKAAYEWEIAMDQLQDKMREDSVQIAKNDAAITKLIISSKNKTIQDEAALANLDRATQLEKENLRITLQNEEAKLALIKERNDRERASINQTRKGLVTELNAVETSANRRKAILKELSSINDASAQEEIDQQIKIIQIKQSSDNLQEKVNNRRDAKLEEIFQNQVKRITEEEILQENLAKEKFLTGVTTAQELEDELYNIKLQGLQNQKELLLSDSRDIIDIDKAILDLELQSRLKSDKEKADLQKAADAKAEKEQKERLAKEAKYKADFDKQQEEEEKKHQANINMLKQAGINVGQTLLQGAFDNNNKKREYELDAELRASQEKTDTATAKLQEQLDKELISQEEFDVRKAALDRKQAAKEADIKRKQFEADKRAKLNQIVIDTAVAVVKTFATLGFPAGIPASLLMIAEGLAQAVVVSSTPTPKFKDGVINLDGKGTGTSDSIHAMLSRGESVMTARETSEHMPILQAIRNNSLNDYIKDSYILPALQSIEVRNNRDRAERENIKDRKLNAILNNMNLDTSNLERATKNNKNVGINNTRQLAKDMAREMQINSNWYK